MKRHEPARAFPQRRLNPAARAHPTRNYYRTRASVNDVVPAYLEDLGLLTLVLRSANGYSRRLETLKLTTASPSITPGIKDDATL